MARLDSVRYKSNSPLAFCPVDRLFVVTAAVASNGGKIIVARPSTINCPTCGASCEMLPGLYASDGDHINFLLDPRVPAEALRKIIESIQAGKITPEQAVNEAEKVHAGWGKLFNISRWSANTLTLSTSLLSAIAIIAAARISSPPAQTVTINTPPAIIQFIAHTKSDLLGSTSITPPAVNHGRPSHPHKLKGNKASVARPQPKPKNRKSEVESASPRNREVS
jgi:hypothetical protein